MNVPCRTPSRRRRRRRHRDHRPLSRPEKKNALSIALRDEVSDAVDGLVRDGP
jgi:enoyl-CoA hydratase/carnithine racemase